MKTAKRLLTMLLITAMILSNLAVGVLAAEVPEKKAPVALDESENVISEESGSSADAVQFTSAGSEDTNVVIYAMDDWAAEYISIPNSYPVTYQIQASGASSVSYTVISGESVEVDQTGLVTPKLTTWYWYSSGSLMYGMTSPNPDLECIKITHDVEYGTSVIRVSADNKTYNVTVEVRNYATTYADAVVDAYIEENITDSMTLEEKLDAICRFPASYNYSVNFSGYTGMIVSGGGDCWASTSLILEVCEKLGIEAIARNGNRDYGAGSGHMNALVIIGDGDYYQLEAGYVGTAPRPYSILHRTSLFCYRSVTGGIEVYQYDGELTDTSTLVVPETIDSKTVVSLGDYFLSNEDVRAVILPNTITSIGYGAFNNCRNLQTLHLPASVASIGSFVFTNCNSLVNFTCSADNPVYTIKDGVLYDKNYTTVFYAPACASVQLPNTVERIAYYAFYYNDNITELTLPASVKTLEEGAIADCHSLKTIILTGVENIGEYAFAGNPALNSVIFESSPPTFADTAFYNTTTTVSYPADNAAWTEDVMQDYSGSITWKSYQKKSGWLLDNGSWYYYNNYAPVTGWQFINSIWYYFDTNGAMQTGWVNVNGTWYYLNTNGAMQTGWLQIGRNWYYLNQKGAMQTGWQQVGRNWYYLNASGVWEIKTGWQNINGTWYFFDVNGTMQTGWLQIGGTWYYFDASGAMATGWKLVNGTWYYFGTNGAMQTGWKLVNGSWYYFGTNGAMVTGWLLQGNVWYYLNTNGAMVTGTQVINGKVYVFNANGVWIG